MNEREYLALVSSFTYFGPVRTKLLLNFFGSAEAIWKTSEKELSKIGLKENIVHSFSKHRKSFQERAYFRKLREKKVRFVTVDEPNYPENLKEIDNPPQVLYYIGELRKGDKNAVAIVGSRKMSSYGKEVAEKFSRELASLGVVIVSGLALGIDAIAHKACYEAGGRGIVVLASGLDIISPYTNRWIAVEIVKHGGSIVSEYPLGHPPFRTSFPSRNRIISGLSKAIIVVEGLIKSGTLLTASAAGEQGRTVFAVPGQITSPLSGAPHYLIQNGAKMVTKVADVLEELDIQLKVDIEGVERVMPTDNMEAKIFRILANETLHIDEISRISRLSTSSVSSKLTIMELKGMVKSLGNGNYKKI